MYATSDLRASFFNMVASGSCCFTLMLVSRICVVTMKKNSNMNTTSGIDEVGMSCLTFAFFLNFDILISSCFSRRSEERRVGKEGRSVGEQWTVHGGRESSEDRCQDGD